MTVKKNIWICPDCGERVVSYSAAAFPGFIADHEKQHRTPAGNKPARKPKQLKEQGNGAGN